MLTPVNTDEFSDHPQKDISDRGVGGAKIKNKETTISTEDPEQAAKGIEKIESQFNDKDELKIGFNSNFILEALGNIKRENITMFLSGPLSAAILSETSKDKKTDKLVLLMPIRLND